MDKFDEIKKYKELLDQGVISEEEFSKIKINLLNLNLSMSRDMPSINMDNKVSCDCGELSSDCDEVPDKWMWALATLPMSLSLILSNAIGMVATIIVIALNCTFMFLDVKLLQEKGKNVDSWMYLGVILVPLYLFVRANKTNRNYVPGIVWCFLFILDLLV